MSKIRIGGLDHMALNPSNSSNLEQLEFKGLNTIPNTSGNSSISSNTSCTVLVGISNIEYIISYSTHMSKISLYFNVVL